MGGDGKAQAHHHAGGISLDRNVDKLLDVSEGYDAVELGADLVPPHAENRAAEKHILASTELRMESGAHLEQGCDTPADGHLARGRRSHTGKQLENRALSRAVVADDA